METKLYGVSSGDGNNGVSHMFADYYVRTNQPYRLAELASLRHFKPGAGQNWAKRHIDINGEAEYTIQACFFNPPCDDTEDGEYPDVDSNGEEIDYESAEDGRNWCDHNGAWLLVEIFPEDEPRDGKRIYESLEDAFSADLLALVPAED